MLNTAATREMFPNGDLFEGVGISPDILIDSMVDDIRSSHDAVLARPGIPQKSARLPELLRSPRT
jgi:hypothetical protein